MEINKSRPLFFIGVPNHLLSIVFAFHHHSQKVIGSLEFCTDIFRQFLKAKPKSCWSSYTGLCSVHRFVFVSTDKCDWVLFFWRAETMIYHAGITYSSCNYWKTYENPVVMYPNVPPTDKMPGLSLGMPSRTFWDTVTPKCADRGRLWCCGPKRICLLVRLDPRSGNICPRDPRISRGRRY